MDQHTYNNWVKIKQTFEASGNTNNMFYIRACSIVKSKKDPLDKFFNKDDEAGRSTEND
jgi:hypothetical protein